ncbi:hypothetical protein BGZ90_000751 [Linnemannia elongata]|nr:hypothetical protein BGZ90_000751 [Linnemannia elongata]
MCSARSQFFTIPELAVNLGPFLWRGDVARLMRTSRFLYDIFASVLFRQLSFSSFDFGLLESSNGLKALARNIHHVREVQSGLLFLNFYYHCQLAYEQQHASQSGTSLELPSWLPPPQPLRLSMIPLPPMHNLTSLACRSTHLKEDLGHPALDKHPNYGRNYIPIVYWLTRSSPNLFKLDFELFVESKQQLLLFTRMISGMRNLQWLRLVIYTSEVFWAKLPLAVFFSLPSSLSTLRLEFGLVAAHHRLFMLNSMEDAVWDRFWDLQGKEGARPLVRRQGPLGNLKVLSFTFYQRPGMTTDEYVALFGDCPGIESLIVPWSSAQLEPAILGRFIGKHCPKLRNVTPSGIRDDTLEELSLYDYSTSVRPLTLADATSEPWASNKLKKLQLRVAMPDMFYLRQKNQRPYFDRLAAAGTTGKQQSLVWNDAEQRQLALLERLYSQIGKQTELEVLDLDAVPGPTSVKRGAGHSFQFDAFPLMLSLGDPEAGYPGYLDLLRGLKRLRRLIGSFGMFSRDSVLTVGEKEVEWMTRHWVSLQEAHFFTRTITPRECFLKLQEQLPGLNIYN